MKIIQIDYDALSLEISDENKILFRRAWVDQMKSLPYDQFGEYIKSNIYPVLTDNERMLWNRTTISNRDLHQAIQEFLST